jgi:hypothetical protein
VQALRAAHRLTAILRFAYDFNRRLVAKDSLDSFPEQRVIVAE